MTTIMAPQLLMAMAGGLAARSRAERIEAIESALKTGAGQSWRNEFGKWITHIVPVEALVPEESRRWRPLVADALSFIFSRVSDRRLAAKLVEQMELPSDTAPEARLLRLISKMPALQKMGQVLARNRRLPPPLREALTQLENGMADVTAVEIATLIQEQLGPRLKAYDVRIERSIFSEASVSAVVRFTWRRPERERERAVFKVLKPYVPDCFAEDMTLLEELGEYLAATDRGYGFAIRDVKEMLAEVRALLEHELDFTREQATLLTAFRAYRSSFGIRVPRLVEPLCTPRITAMSEESGVKVTAACRKSVLRRGRIAEQIVQALVAVPLLSREEEAIFHADPHAGNLLYDEPNRELVVLDWALAESLSLEFRRQLAMLVLMMAVENRAGVEQVIQALSRKDTGPRRAREQLIARHVERFFDHLPPDRSPGALDAMRLLDEIAMDGVRFPGPLFLFRKILFTLDGVLQDIAEGDVRIDRVIAREFLTRWIASVGLFHSPLALADFVSVEWNALLYPVRRWMRAGRRQE